MKLFSLLAIIFSLGLAVTAGDAEARRLGGGKSAAMQRQMTVPNKAAVAPARAPTAAAAQTPAGRSWMGPVAGLAAGLGLAALASHLGFGEQMASMLLIGLLLMAGLAVAGWVMRRRAMPQSGATGGPDGLRYAAPEGSPTGGTYDRLQPSPGASQLAPGAPEIPSGFDVEGFVRHAKVNFVRLQAANDAADLVDLREFTTPEMFAELKIDISERGGATQVTDVLQIDAEVIEVVEEAARHVVSVRFTGLIREEKETGGEAINEVWHLVKPRHGKGGWLLAGIQQMQ